MKAASLAAFTPTPEPTLADLRLGDCMEVMRTLADNSIDSCVTDPPYDLTAKGGSGGGFMGKAWDGTGIAFDPATWKEVLRVLKPGAHVVAFGGSRTYHRMACAIEDAGFEIRDSIHWHYGNGFPKSLNLGDGRGTALKPAHEPIVLARKPLVGTVAANVAAHGTGTLNIDACRLTPSGGREREGEPSQDRRYADEGATNIAALPGPRGGSPDGRWPPNVLFTHSPYCSDSCDTSCPVLELDRQSGIKTSGNVTKTYSPTLETSPSLGKKKRVLNPDMVYADTGGASRFFPTFEWEEGDWFPFQYVAKAARSEREVGTAGLPSRAGHEAVDREEGSAGVQNPRAGAGRTAKEVRNFHPTVKPVALMRWLTRLVTPTGGVVLEPFLGSGTTGVACVKEGLRVLGIEREAEYMNIASARIGHALKGTP